MNRRKFFQSASALAGVMAIQPSVLGMTGQRNAKKMSDRVALGSTGIEVSRMAIGTGTNGWGKNSNQTRQLGIRGLAELLRFAFERGVTFWDTADQYGTHPHLNEGLKLVPREKVAILTKTHASTRNEMKADMDRFRKELGTDYIDIILLHCMMKKDWPGEKQGAMEYLTEMREKKIIRAHGVSCHTLDALKTAAANPWVQIDLARINPAGAEMDAGVTTVVPILKQMKQSGKVIMGMKVFGAGQLSSRREECVRFALSQDYMDCFTIGIENQSQLLDLEKLIPALS